MTPSEMAMEILKNIEATRAVMEDGPVGYVLATADKMHLLCQKPGGQIFKSHPQNDAVLVLTSHARAVTAQRYWNHHNPDDKVKIALRREAMQAYIDEQQNAHNILLTLIQMKEQLG